MKPCGIILICLLILFPVQQSGDVPSADNIMERVDDVLSPSNDFSMYVTVINKEPGDAKKVTKFKMLAKGRDRTLLMTLSPENKRGRNLLFDRLDLWVFMPSVRRPFKISLQERLTGEAANADLARANYSRDYSAALVGIEMLGGKRCYRMELLARSDDAPYHKVSMWIEVETFYPVKAEYHARSGRLLKECSFEDFRPMLGVQRPTRLILKNAVDGQKLTVLQYSDWTGETLPMKFFDKSYIDKTKY